MPRRSGPCAGRRPTRRARSNPSSQTLAGETLDVEPSPAPEEPAPGEEAADPAAEARPPSAPEAPAPAPPRPGSHAPRAAATGAERAAAAPAPPALFGAVGVRFASNLATTFTRAFPQAASADPVWTSTAFGGTGAAEVTLVLDDDGHIDKTVVEGSPSVALRRGVERTLALLGRGRAFTARGAVTTMRITARVSRDDVHDGMHGDVFALSGGSFAGEVGSAFFALPAVGGPGRRVDIEVRLLP